MRLLEEVNTTTGGPTTVEILVLGGKARRSEAMVDTETHKNVLCRSVVDEQAAAYGGRGLFRGLAILELNALIEKSKLSVRELPDHMPFRDYFRPVVCGAFKSDFEIGACRTTNARTESVHQVHDTHCPYDFPQFRSGYDTQVEKAHSFAGLR